MLYETIIVNDDGRIRTITLNRPERHNAMTPTMQTELIHTLKEAAESNCRVVVVKGAGGVFCAGLDLSVLGNLSDQTAVEHRADAERVAILFRTLYELPKPTLAAVEGAAIAGGAGLATICDFTLAVPKARFGYTEVKIGFVPALVSAFLSLQIGDKRARDLLLSGRLIDAAEAHRLGLVSEVVGAEEMTARVDELAALLAANSPQSMAATKRLMAEQNKPWLDAAIDQALRANSAARQTADFREGISAFLEKRPAVWEK